MNHGWTGRRGPMVAECVVLGLLLAVDIGWAVHAGLPSGLIGQAAFELVPGQSTAVALLAVLRRRFPKRVLVLGCVVAALSLIGTGAFVASAALGQPLPMELGLTELLALALLVGSAARRLAPVPAVVVVTAGAVAMIAQALLRYGFGGLVAVPTAVVWGGALAVGLLLRDADFRRSSALSEVRVGERLLLARELHDLVAHHITGVVVLSQAGRRIAPERDEVFGEIEQAGAEALAAMRRLVGMLRTEGELDATPSGLLDAVERAVPPEAQLTVQDGLDVLSVTPEAATTVHRVIQESVTNAHRHAPQARQIEVAVRVDDEWLVVEVVNDGVRAAPGGHRGYGLVGMAERVDALGGSLLAGAVPGQRWRVSARLPLVRTV
ncbi:sensor histidine kinase [Kutzneria sp. CA-103260]|uniref:sensor histidine kinase n=1 Tax=Kutzneria sp. CA-103260 TaxID=2802641 RepID=UPI001BA8952B|nr:histidine kinase [Kutzneria sp. CA-103260]QUQ62369.1 two-component system histidine kinase [Kutzneria sp. CA-103260]